MGISIPFVGSLWPWKKEEEPLLPPKLPPEPMTEKQREVYMKRWETFKRENKQGTPDYRRSKRVEEDLAEHSLFAQKDKATPEELEENHQVWEKLESNDFLKFLAKSEDYAEKGLKDEFEENDEPFWAADWKMWEALPPVRGPFNGAPMPKKSMKTSQEGKDKFLDFFKEHLLGIWGYRNRPYPSGRPCDVQQALGTDFLEERNYDYLMKYGRWYYKDRLGRTRGPMHVINLKTAMASGIVDKNTFVWGDDMDEWAPLGMVYGLEHAVNGPDVKFAAAGTALIYRMCKALPPWVPIKGRERKTYEQLQKEGIECKEREKAVIRQHGGVWPGQMIPSHTLFLWASGSELTPLIEGDTMPNRFLSYQLRKDLAKVIPGLRPSDVLTLERVMYRITYNEDWYRVPLGEYNRQASYFPQIMRTDKQLVDKWWSNWVNLERKYPEVVADAFRNQVRKKIKQRLKKCYDKLQQYEERAAAEKASATEEI